MTIPVLSAHFNPNINLSLRVHNSSGLNNRPLAELEIALKGIMASKRAVFSAFTVEALLSSDHFGEKNDLRQEDEEAPKSADKESDSGGSFCTGNCFLHLLLLIYIYIDISYTCVLIIFHTQPFNSFPWIDLVLNARVSTLLNRIFHFFISF